MAEENSKACAEMAAKLKENGVLADGTKSWCGTPDGARLVRSTSQVQKCLEAKQKDRDPIDPGYTPAR